MVELNIFKYYQTTNTYPTFLASGSECGEEIVPLIPAIMSSEPRCTLPTKYIKSKQSIRTCFLLDLVLFYNIF
jgi:hypothetical protein